ncbi:MAG: glycosyltransferase family 39 protein [Anaerolineae bacterium]|nr:glycosyltransferase family 39 protein [Anaerolineae bacterium]
MKKTIDLIRKFTIANQHVLLITAVTIIGFFLRIYRVGEDSFWYDEAGQAMAAMQPRISDMFKIVQSHAGAMPLDYFVSRIMASISLHESIMRLPSVIWGTLTIPICYLLFNEIEIPYKKNVSLLTAFLLSISPLHIQYSQEMRFYAALMFFYLLATLFLIRALKNSTVLNWSVYFISACIGAYFHPYVLMTVLTGFIILFSKLLETHNISIFWREHKNKITAYMAINILLVLVFLPGYFFFHSQDTYSYALDLRSDTILYGLGLKAIVTSKNLPPFGIWHLFQIITLAGGIFISLIYLKRTPVLAHLTISIMIQIVSIIILDITNNYPFIPRQIIHLAPFTLFLSSIAVTTLFFSFKKSKLTLLIAIVGILFLSYSSLLYTYAMYNQSKGNAREIASLIVDNYQAGQKVLVLSAQHETILRFYLTRLVGETNSTEMTTSVENDEDVVSEINTNPDIYFVFAPRETNSETRAAIEGLGFKQVKAPRGTDFLFIRP